VTPSSPAPLDPSLYREIVRRALAEDLGWGDVTTDATVPGDARARATVSAVDSCVVAGLAVADEAFHQLDPAVRMSLEHRDGDAVPPGVPIASWEGRAGPLLTAQRTALNFLERLSGIATATRRIVDAAGDRARVVSTRSTTPTLRALEHYAVEVGGGGRVRGALDGAVVICQPHVILAGGIRGALSRVAHVAHELPIEVEVTSGDEAREAVEAGAPRLLVVQPAPGVLASVLDAARGRVPVHVSGDFTPEEVAGFSQAGAEMVSAVGITRRAPWAALRIAFEPLP
jgi:nicotinate-nucleotide pyrophosphorylase (carboxylating)